MGRFLKISGLLPAMAAVAASARAQDVAGEVPLADVLEILVVDRDLLAIDAAGGGRTAALRVLIFRATTGTWEERSPDWH